MTEIRIKHIVIKNIKNVKYGEINFSVGKDGFHNVTGIYGQNGSGKTTVVNVFEVLKALIMGEEIPQKCSGIFSDDDKSPSEISLEIEHVGISRIKYSVQLAERSLNDNHQFYVLEEKIQHKKLELKARLSTLLHYKLTDIRRGYNGDYKLQSQLKSHRKIATDDALDILTYNSFYNRTSLIFRSDLLKLIYQKKETFGLLLSVLECLNNLALNFRIYTSELLGMISGNDITVVGINLKNQTNKIQGFIPFSLAQDGMMVPESLIPAYRETIQYMNQILPVIIPNLTIGLNEGETEITSEQIKMQRLTFLAIRDGKVFSLIHESDGIKKIIGMLGYLVEVYNNPNIITIIDELDSGVFEYLLGELIQIYSDSAKGQLIFTSHNLRILEMLPSNKIIFSTANENKRYIRLTGVKPSNNLRDYYLRAIQLGGQEEKLYIGQTKSKIRRALRKAGKHIAK